MMMRARVRVLSCFDFKFLNRPLIYWYLGEKIGLSHRRKEHQGKKMTSPTKLMRTPLQITRKTGVALAMVLPVPIRPGPST